MLPVEFSVPCVSILHPGAEVQAHGKGGLSGRLLSGDPLFLIGQRGEIGAVALEAGGTDIGEVVGDDAHPRILRFKPRAGDV